MRRRIRPFLARCGAAAILAGSAGACSDFLAVPAEGPTRLTVAYARYDGAPPDPGIALVPVDQLHVRLASGGVPVVDSAFAVADDGGVVRGSVQVELQAPEEEMELDVELRWQGVPQFRGHATVRILRGIHNAVEVVLQPAGATGALVVGVANALNGQPLSGATVNVRAGASAPATAPVVATTLTGADGQARFAALPAGPYTLFVTAPSMIETIVPDVVVDAGNETVQSVAEAGRGGAGPSRRTTPRRPAGRFRGENARRGERGARRRAPRRGRGGRRARAL